MDILQQLFEEIHIPQAVRYEIEAFFRSDDRWQACLDKGFIIVHTVHSSSFLNQPLHILHQGEAEMKPNHVCGMVADTMSSRG